MLRSHSQPPVDLNGATVLVGLTATKILTEKRAEFFREAGSGYNIDAYFVAVNIFSTVEHSIEAMIASMFALWLRNSIAAWYSYYIHFLLLAWLCVSWALLFPLLVPPRNVVLVTGFYMTFLSLLFSGGIAPVTYQGMFPSKVHQTFETARMLSCHRTSNLNSRCDPQSFTIVGASLFLAA